MKSNRAVQFVSALLMLVLWLPGGLSPTFRTRTLAAGLPLSPTGSYRESTGQIMARQSNQPHNPTPIARTAAPVRDPFASGQIQLAEKPLPGISAPALPTQPSAAQTVGKTFTSYNTDQLITMTGGSVNTPPDTMGAVGPTQFLTVLNAVIRVNSKTTGAIGALDTTSNNFFNSVRNGDGTGDPRVRYDRLTDRWIVTCFTDAATDNRILIAVSDQITGDLTVGTMWTFYYFIAGSINAVDANQFADYPTLGVDANALYMGTSMFDAGGAFIDTTAFVINKAALLAGTGGDLSGMAGAITGFPGLSSCTGCAGMFTVQGADNYNPTGNDPGYLIATGNANDTLIIRKVNNPGSATPTLGNEILVNVPQGIRSFNTLSINTADTANDIDSLEYRLMAAHLRDGHLWTSNTQFVDATGAVSGAAGARAAVRYYELNVTTTTPSLEQVGTVFDNAATNPFNYWMGTVMVSGQGHAALGFSRTSGASGAGNWPAAATVGRLAGDPAGTLSGLPIVYQAGKAPFPGFSFETPPSRWGDYSLTSLDPCDDMTLWTIQEFSDAITGTSGTNYGSNWGVSVAQLLAPAPTITNLDTNLLPANTANITVTVNGTGFYNPPTAGMSACRKGLTASASSPLVTIKQVTYVNPAKVLVKLSTGANGGPVVLSLHNPDGQTVTANLTVGGCFVTPDNGTNLYFNLQTAIDAAPNGGHLKVAGTCDQAVMHAGSTQIAYFDKNLTVTGGYSASNWSTSNPQANPTTLDAKGLGRVVYVPAGMIVALSNLNMTGGMETTGGGVYNLGNLTITNSQIYANQATTDAGGGIANLGTLHVNRTAVRQNSANTLDAGGLYNTDGQALVENSTFSDNQANQGGAIVNDGQTKLTHLDLINSTVYSNTANFVGGVGNAANGITATMTVANSTIISNTSPMFAGGLSNWSNAGTAMLTVQDTLLANNSNANLDNTTAPTSTLTSLGNNLADDDGNGLLTGPGDQTNTAPQLGPFKNNGGPTFTLAPRPGSPALDQGSCAGTTITTDQRGVPRPQGPACDIGAVEDILPQAAILAQPPVGNEGSPIAFTAVITQATLTGLNPQSLVSWNFGDGSTLKNVITPTHAYQDNSVYTATLKVQSIEGLSAIAQRQLTINNVAPTVQAGPNQNGKVGQTLSFTGTFTDPGALDTHTYHWDFGDQSTSDGSLTPTHSYSAVGKFTVTLTVTDKDGGVGTGTLAVNIIPANTKLFMPLLRK